MKKLKGLLISLLVLCLVAGCGGSKDTPAGAEGQADAKVLTVATTTDIQSMDYHLATDGTSFIAIANMVVGLTEIDANNQVQPEIAKKWDVSEDGTEYTFYLDEAAVWANGTPVTAKDFVFGWDRLGAEETASEYSFILDTVGMESYEAVDDYTLNVKLKAPCDFFLGLLAFPSFFPLNEEFYIAQGDQYALSVDNLLANGPYVMTEWVAGNSFGYKKNDTYFKKDQVKLDSLQFKVLKDTQSAMIGFESNEVDVVQLSGELVDAYKDRPEFVNRLTGYLWYLSLNFTKDVINNDNLRKALSLSIDREKVAKNVLKDGSIAAAGIIPYGLATGPDGKDFRDSTEVLTKTDYALAKEYWETAKTELGVETLELELLFEDTEASKSVAEFIKSEIETALPGLTINLKSQTKKARLQLMTNQEYEVALTRWGPDYADPQTYLDLFPSWNTSNNSGLYNSSEYDALVKEAFQGASSSDSSARWELMKQAEKVLVGDDTGIIPVYQNGGAMMIATNVSGIEFHSVSIDSYKRATKD